MNNAHWSGTFDVAITYNLVYKTQQWFLNHLKCLRVLQCLLPWRVAMEMVNNKTNQSEWQWEKEHAPFHEERLKLKQDAWLHEVDGCLKQ